MSLVFTYNKTKSIPQTQQYSSIQTTRFRTLNLSKGLNLSRGTNINSSQMNSIIYKTGHNCTSCGN